MRPSCHFLTKHSTRSRDRKSSCHLSPNLHPAPTFCGRTVRQALPSCKGAAHAHKRKSILSEHPLRSLVGHCMDQETTGATAMPIVCPTHHSYKVSDAFMASSVSCHCAASGLGTKRETVSA